MFRASDRTFSRRDTWAFVLCLALAVGALFSPAAWGFGIANVLRGTVLLPFVWLQERAEEGKTSRVRLRAVTTQRDSAAIVAQFLPSLTTENERLRELLGLSRRLATPYVAAEVLHQAQITDGRMLLLSAGKDDGVAAFDPVVAPEGLIGVVWNVAGKTSVAMTWAHPEFRVSAYTVDGKVFGMVAAAPSASVTEASLEFRAVTYRDPVAPGTLVLSSGLGGVYPRGIPVGTVLGVEREQAGWERVYRLQPAATPSATGHVLILTAPRTNTLARAFAVDSASLAAKADSVRAAHAPAPPVTPAPTVPDTTRKPAKPDTTRKAAKPAATDSTRKTPKRATDTTSRAPTAGKDSTP